MPPGVPQALRQVEQAGNHLGGGDRFVGVAQQCV
jgi:hypothetical protein